MNKVIQIRGGNGSGKTHVARQIMSRFTFIKENKLPSGVIINVYDQFISIGKYHGGIVCGGADTVKTPTLVWDTIIDCIAHKNVLVEGILTSTVYAPVMELKVRLDKVPASLHLLCLSTEFDQCVANVNSRRADAGKGPLERLVNLETNHKKHLSSARKFRAAGMNPRWVSADEAVEIVIKEFGL